MGWLGGVWVLLPERCWMWVQRSDELVEWEQDSILPIQACRLFWAIEEAI